MQGFEPSEVAKHEAGMRFEGRMAVFLLPYVCVLGTNSLTAKRVILEKFICDRCRLMTTQIVGLQWRHRQAHSQRVESGITPLSVMYLRFVGLSSSQSGSSSVPLDLDLHGQH